MEQYLETLQYIKGEQSMIREFLIFFDEQSELTDSGDMYYDFIIQLGGKSFGRGYQNVSYRSRLNDLDIAEVLRDDLEYAIGLFK